METQIKVLTKPDPKRTDPGRSENISDLAGERQAPSATNPFPFPGIKHESEAKAFNLIDDKRWDIVRSEPSSESNFFIHGHSAMNIISVIGPKGVGKSSLLNKIAGRNVFKTHEYLRGSKTDHNSIIKHKTRGIDIHSTHHRILLDCQPLRDLSVLDNFLSGYSSSQFPRSSPISDPLTSYQMISLQLAAFLLTSCDSIIIMVNWLVDMHFLEVISTALMLIGDRNLKAKFIVYLKTKPEDIERVRIPFELALGRGRVEKYVTDEMDLIDTINPYCEVKSQGCDRNLSTFKGRNWLLSSQRLWDTSIKNSPIYTDYATQLHDSNETS